MATRTVRQQDPVDLPRTEGAEPTALTPSDATGYLCQNWLPFGEHAAVQFNADAPVGALAVWCWAEVETLIQTARMASAAIRQDAYALVNDEAFEKMFQHRLQPLERALHMIVERLAKEHRA